MSGAKGEDRWKGKSKKNCAGKPISHLEELVYIRVNGRVEPLLTPHLHYCLYRD